MSGVFISYRREDSAGWTGRIYDRACARFGAESVFLDVEAISPGQDFVKTIRETLRRADFVLVVIGSKWISATGEDGHRRLDDPADYVRREIATALESDSLVVPVLVDGARVPAEQELPKDIVGLSHRNAVTVTGTRFDDDIERLLETLLRETTGDETPEAPPHNLPTQLTPFIGRTDEIRTIKQALDNRRFVSLLGPGGSGKTRLALQVAADHLYRYEDGAWLVDLREIERPDEVLEHVATSLRVVTSGDVPLLNQLEEALRPRRLLLVLDNCEHVLDGVAQLVERLFARSGSLRVLATSREALGLSGETVLPIDPLHLPAGHDMDQLLDSDAVRLFVDRSRTADQAFHLGDHTAAVFEVCTAVEGLPLALELAAARLRAFSPEELARRLKDQMGLLKTSRKAGDLRHATIEATIRWSWDLLSDEERALFSRLSILRGTWSSAVAEGICGFAPIDRDAVMDLLESLVEKSLVVVDSRGESTRYRVLEPLRQFAAQRMDENTTENLRHRCIDYWAHALEAPPRNATIGAVHQYVDAAWELEPDQSNLVASIEWALRSGRYRDAAVILASPFGNLLVLLAAPSDVVARWVDTAFEHRDEIPRGVMMMALDFAMSVFAEHGDNEDWLRFGRRGMELAQTDEQRQAFEANSAMATNRLGRRDEAVAMFDRVYRDAADPGLRALALIGKMQFAPPKEAWSMAQRVLELIPLEENEFQDESYAAWSISAAAAGVGDYALATEMARRSWAASRRWGYAVMAAIAAENLALMLLLRGLLSEADAVMQEAETLTRRILGATTGLVWVLVRSSDVARFTGDLTAARRYVDEARELAEQTEFVFDVVAVARYEAMVARDEGDAAGALQLLADADSLIESTGLNIYPKKAIRLSRAGIELSEGRADSALDELSRVLEEPDAIDHYVQVLMLDMIAIGLAQATQAAPAARLFAAVDAERERTGLVCYPPDVPLREAALDGVRTALGDDWASATETGRGWSIEEAVSYAARLLATEGA